jgi:2-dehydropantoate 2-reductase
VSRENFSNNCLPFERIAVIGAGAVGGAFASLLSKSHGDSLFLIANEERSQGLAERGLIVNGHSFVIPVLTPHSISAPVDLVIVAVKHHHLNEAILDMKCAIGPGTIILSLLNGIESEEEIGAVYGMEKLLFGLVLGIDALREGNRIRYTTQGRIFFGEATNDTLTERVLRVQSLFRRAGIAYVTPRDMIRTLWFKFMINVGINQVSVVLRADYSVFQKAGGAREMMESAMREVILLARKAGIDLSEDDITQWHKVLSGLSPKGKTSMLQDVEAGRKTEVEIFAGNVIELGKRYGVFTPVNEQLFEAIKNIEASASAK